MVILPSKQSWGKAIDAARKRAGLTKYGLAKHVGCWTTDVQQWCGGIRAPNTNNLLALCDAMGEDVMIVIAEAQAIEKARRSA